LDTAMVFRIPEPPKNRRWRRLIDTSIASPHDVSRPEDAVPVLSEGGVLVRDRSFLVLLAGGPLAQRSAL